jgi:hypothetical protein
MPQATRRTSRQRPRGQSKQVLHTRMGISALKRTPAKQGGAVEAVGVRSRQTTVQQKQCSFCRHGTYSVSKASISGRSLDFQPVSGSASELSCVQYAVVLQVSGGIISLAREIGSEAAKVMSSVRRSRCVAIVTMGHNGKSSLPSSHAA